MITWKPKLAIVDRAEAYLKRVGVRHTGFLGCHIQHDPGVTRAIVLLSIKQSSKEVAKLLKKHGWFTNGNVMRNSRIPMGMIKLSQTRIKLMEQKKDERV